LAYDATTGASLGEGSFDVALTGLAVGLLYDYSSDIPSIPNYAPIDAAHSAVMITLDATTIRVYYLPLPEGEIPVEVRAGSAAGELLQKIFLMGYPGDTVSFDPTGLDLKGYAFDEESPDNRLTVDFDPDDPDNDRIIVIMRDVRATLTVQIQLGNALPVVASEEKLAVPFTKTVFAPYRGGFVLMSYQIDDEEPVTTGVLDAVALTGVAADATVTFVYQPIEEYIIDQFVRLTVQGLDGTTELYSYTRLVPMSSTAIDISFFNIPSYRLKTTFEAPGNLPTRSVVPDEDQTVTFEYQSLATTVTIKAYMAGGTSDADMVPGFEPFSMAAQAKSDFIVSAPAIDGYKNVLPLPSPVAVTEDAESNVLIFYYSVHMGNLIIEAVEATTGSVIGYTSRTLETGSAFSVSDANAPSDTLIPALANYSLVSKSSEIGYPEQITYDGIHALPIVTYEYERNTASVTLLAFSSEAGHLLGYDVEALTNQPVGLMSADYSGFFESIPNYTLVPNQLTRVMVAPGGTSVNVFYRPLPMGLVPVEVRAGSAAGELLETIYIHGYEEDQLTFDPSGYSRAGYSFNETSPDNRLSITYDSADPDNDRLIMIMADIRGSLTVQIQLGSALPVDWSTEKLVRPISRTVFAPYQGGFVLRAYQIDGGEPVETGTLEEVALEEVDASSTVVTFIYQPLREFVDDQFVTLSVEGVVGSGLNATTLYSYELLVERGVDTSITAIAVPGHRLLALSEAASNTNPRLLTPNSNTTVTFEYKSLATTVAVKAYLVDGTSDADMVPGFVPFDVDVMAGTVNFNVSAPAIAGYQNTQLASPISVSEDSTANELIFFYEPHLDNLIIKAVNVATKEAIGYTSVMLATNATLTSLDANAPTVAEIPALVNYSLVANSGTPASITNNGSGSLLVTYEYARNTADLQIEASNASTGASIGGVAPVTVSSLPVGLLYDYSADIRNDIPGFTLLGSQISSVMMASGGVTVQVYYLPVPEGQVPVELRVLKEDVAYDAGNPATYDTLPTLYLTSAAGEMVSFDPDTLDIPGFAVFGTDGDGDNLWTIASWNGSDSLIVMMADVRPVVTTQIQLAGALPIVYGESVKVLSGGSKTVHAT